MKNVYSIRRPVANVYLVRERDRRLRRDLLTMLAVAVPLSLALLAYLWVSSQVWATGYEVRRLEQQLGAQIERERALTVEVAELSRLGRVERAAAELGLTPLAVEQVAFGGELE